jgi:putative SOS response-associated peptidase YedK
LGVREELRYTLSTIDGFAPAFAVAVPEVVAPRYPIAPDEHAPVVLGGACELRRWGMLRRFRGHGGRRGPPIYTAPLDAVAQVPQLRDAQPCLVIADGVLARRGPFPLWVHPEPPRLVAFAGLAETSKDDEVASFVLVVGESLVQTLDQAMPIAIAPDAYTRWLDGGELVRAPADDWRADASSKIENPGQRELF